MLPRIPALLQKLREGSDGVPHTSPFERSLLHFQATVDTATHIHILKHRHISVNGESARYRAYREDKFYIPADWPEDWSSILEYRSQDAYDRYHQALEELTPKLGAKRAKETARFLLPYSIQVNLDLSMCFLEFTHFQRLRATNHAQDEIHSIADEMLRLVRDETNGAFEHSLKAWGLY
jgi:thymidylate synthase (FAD)